MRIAVLFATLTLMTMGTLTVSAQTSSSPDTMQGKQSSMSSGASTLTGCLKGSNDHYYLVESNGHRHMLHATGQDLSSHVNHIVTLSGKADTTRSVGGSSDAEGHRHGFFAVDSVTDDQGACKKK